VFYQSILIILIVCNEDVMSRVYTSEDIPELEKEMEDFERRSAEIMEEYGRNEKSYVNDGAGKRARGLALAIDFLSNIHLV